MLFLLASYSNHKIQLSKEDEWFIPLGKMVEVNGHKIHVYSEGEGDATLVYMSGGGISSPVLDFKSLYSRLSDQNQIVVIKKLGYGFSDVANVARAIDTILFETRAALVQANSSRPFI